MRFPYHQIDDDSIEPAGNIQDVNNHRRPSDDRQRNDDLEDLPSPSFKQLLPHWPFILGIFQVVFGFICAIFGIVVIVILPFKISLKAEISLNKFNSFGAALWSGLLLVISGSCAIRTSKVRSLISVQQFYLVTVFSFLANTAFLILILWCYMYLHGDVWNIKETPVDIDVWCSQDDLTPEQKSLCDLMHTIQHCSIVSLMSAVWCIFGCLLLFLSTVNYSHPVLFGEVHLLKSLAVCWLPCWFYSVQYETLRKSEFYKRATDI